MDNVSGITLNPELICGYHLEVLADGLPLKNEVVRQRVEELHTANGWLPLAVQDPREQFTKSLRLLRESGKQKNPTEGYWRLSATAPIRELPRKVEIEDGTDEEAEFTVGDGPESNYGWYHPAYRKLAELQDNPHFPVKVGRKVRTPNQPIEESWGMLPERPCLGFHFRCEAAGHWERVIHARLSLNRRNIYQAIEREWFNTNLDELVSLVKKDISINVPAQAKPKGTE